MCLGQDLMQKEATGIGCCSTVSAREIETAENDRQGWTGNMCKYANTCKAAQDEIVFEEYCSQSGAYCIEAIIRGGGSQ